MVDEDKYREAGRIAALVMEEGLKKVNVGEKLLEVAEFVEKRISDLGGKPAFPINISINERAAHYTPDADDESVFKEGDLVKLDIGVHVDGFIGDIARSKDLEGGHKELIKAAERALDAAVSLIKPGVRSNEVGQVIEETISSFGFKPVSNLTGHALTAWNLHGGVVIPNVRTMHGYEFKAGDVFAIEPFSTNGAGRVVDEPRAMIFRYLGERPIRMREARVLLAHIKEHYSTLPFAERWIAPVVPKNKLGLALKQLVVSKALHAYHVLKEKEKGFVAQAEDSIRVTEDGCVVLTRK